jgi:hypothetical protein
MDRFSSKDVAVISGRLDTKKRSWTALDGMTRRLNACRAFVRKPAEAADRTVKTDL